MLRSIVGHVDPCALLFCPFWGGFGGLCCRCVLRRPGVVTFQNNAVRRKKLQSFATIPQKRLPDVSNKTSQHNTTT
eukprot:8731398-Pyramimonas_sp.AAC.1